MKRQTVIVITAPGLPPEVWGNLRKACEAKGWNYSTFSKKKLPFKHGEIEIFRVDFQ